MHAEFSSSGPKVCLTANHAHLSLHLLNPLSIARRGVKWTLLLIYLSSAPAIGDRALDNSRSLAAVPPGASVQWVAEAMQVNGQLMAVQSLQSKRSSAEIVAFYRQAWADNPAPAGSPPYVENEVGEWRIIASLANGEQTVVQVKADKSGGSQGFISAMATDIALTSIRRDTFPSKAGTELLADTESSDGGRVVRTLVMRNDYSLASNVGFYRDTLPGQAWLLQFEFSNQSSAALLFSNGKRQLELALERKGARTLVIANMVGAGK